MRYLVTFKVMAVLPELAKTAADLLEATEAWIERERKAGTLIEAWATTDTSGGVAIIEGDSNDAVYQKLMELPFVPFVQYTVTPLTDLKLALETSVAFFKKMAGE